MCSKIIELTTNMNQRDKEKRDALIVEDEKNIFLEAGAGAGKSTLLVSRIVNQIVNKKQKIDEIVAITFTEKAATELEEKIAKRLDEKLIELDEDDELRKEIAEKRDSLFIGTIHSFCQKIIKERPLESGIPIRYEMIEEKAEENKRKQFFYNAINKETETFNELFIFLENFGFKIYDLFDLFHKKVSDKGLDLKEIQLNETMDLKSIKASITPKINYLKESITVELKPIQLQDLTKDFKEDVYKVLKALATDEEIISKRSNYRYYQVALEKLYQKLDIPNLKQKYQILCELFTGEIDCDGETTNLASLFTGMMRSGKLTNPFILLNKFHQGIGTEEGLKIKEKKWFKDNEPKHPNIKAQMDKVLKIESIDTLIPILNEPLSETFTFNPTQEVFDLKDEQNPYKLLLALTKKSIDALKDKRVFDVALNKEKLETEIVEWKKKVDISDELEALNAIIQNLLSRWALEYLNQNQTGELVFDDLLFKAFKILENKEARQFFHQKYRHLYVDEVQDTDPLQMKILFLLTAKNNPEKWEDAIPAENSLFLVGDPKQSIYRFRNADLRIYNQIKEIAKACDEWKYEELTINYRSNETLINWFNEKYKGMFERELNQFIQPQYMDMDVSFKRASVQGPHVNFYEKNDDTFLPLNNEEFLEWFTENEQAMEAGVKFYQLEHENIYETEATYICNWIIDNVHKMKVRSIEKLKDYDNRFEIQYKPLQYKDILIILPKTKAMGIYIQKMHDAGIPTSFSGKIQISDFKEINRLMALVHFLANPNKETLLTAYLICKQQTVVDTFSLQKDKSFEELLELEEFAAFKSMQEVAKKMNAHSFIEYVVYDNPKLVVGEALSDLELKTSLSVLTTFIEKIRPMQFSSLKEMSHRFKRMIVDREEMEYEMSIDENADAVRIMNLHKSKGLEAAVVFLAGDSTFKEDVLTSYIERQQGEEDKVYYSFFRKGGFDPIIIHQPDYLKGFAGEMKRHENAEFIRLLYVAATRAKQLLFIGMDKDNEKVAEKYSSWYSLYLGETEDVEVLEISDDINIQQGEEKVQYFSGKEKKLSDSFKEAQSYIELSPSKLAGMKNVEVDENDDSADEDTALEDTKQFKGPLWGSIVHKAFEMYMLELQKYKEKVNSPLISNEVEQYFLEKVLDEKFYSIAIVRGLTQYELSTKEMALFDLSDDLGNNRNARLQQIVNNGEIRAQLKKNLLQLMSNEEMNQFLYNEASKILPEVSFKSNLLTFEDEKLEEFKTIEAIHQYLEDKGMDVYLNGVIDLVVELEDVLYIIDYKTNALPEELSIQEFHDLLKEYYANQVLTYNKIAHSLFSKKVAGVYLYLTATNSLIEIHEGGSQS